MKQLVKKLIFVAPLFLFSFIISAQETEAYKKAKMEIQEQFGMMPSMFEVYPKQALPGAWENFKQLTGPGSKIPGKYRELAQLAVASQIPCAYCIYFHTESAKAQGATDEEIHEAIALGADTRQWSTILQGNQIDLEKFKAEFKAMMKFMSEKQKEKKLNP